MDLKRIGEAAKAAERVLSIAGTNQKNDALYRMADAFLNRQDEWLSANRQDLEEAERSGMRTSMLDRLKLTPERIAGIVQGIREIAALPDPIGTVDRMTTRPNGLLIGRKRVPLGVIAIIYEARPNVTADAAALCLKSGNVCILRGGKEAIHSNLAAESIMRSALTDAGLPAECISLVHDTSRETAQELMHLNGYVDVLIPRGGAGLIRSVAEHASVPVIRTGEGVCHLYIDQSADLDLGAKVLLNAKCSRPSVCNAVECVLIHESVAQEFLKRAVPLLDAYSVELRCDPFSLRILGDRGVPASDSDWDMEYGDYILAVKTVSGLDEAVDFISRHGTGHSESIITESYSAAQEFLNRVDAAAVYVNASTRFTDGGEFGLGAEIGISTQKMHARGPMGLEELTSIKYIIYGNGQVR